MATAGGWNSFSEGLQRGSDISLRWLAQQRADEQHRAEMEERGLRMAQARDVRAATEDLTRAASVGVNDRAATAALDADFERANQLAMQGQDVPVFQPQNFKPEFRQATTGELAQRGLRVAAARGDVNQVMAAKQAMNTAEEDEIFAKADITPENIAWLNANNSKLGIVPLKDKRGNVTNYRITDYANAGDPRDFNLSKADSKKLAGAVALMERNPSRALEIISGIDKQLAETVARENGITTSIVQTGNQAARYLSAEEQDRTRTGIAFGQANRPQYLQLINERNEPVLVDQNRLPQKDGVLQLPPGLRMAKLPQTLSDQEKIGYEEYLKAVQLLPPNAPQAQRDRLAQEFGVTRIVGGGRSGLPGWGQGQSVPTPQRAAPTQRPAAPPNAMLGQKFGVLTPRSVIEEAAAAGNPEAIRALQVLSDNDAALEMQRADPMLQYGPR